MMIKDWKKDIFTIPNLFSLFRLLLIPVYVVIYISAKKPEDYYLAAAILAVSCITDLVDGKIARYYNMVSTLGKILDPFADKATQFTLILCLAIRKPIIRSLVGLFVIKEIFQLTSRGFKENEMKLIAGWISIRKGRILKGALFSGKLCTTVLFISLTLLVMLPDLSDRVITIVTIIDLIFLSIAFVDYIVTYCKRDNKFQKISETK